MKHTTHTLLLLLTLSCATTETNTDPEPMPEVFCFQPTEIVRVVKESCGVIPEFTPAVDQSVRGIVICVLDPEASAMLCMTPEEAVLRADRHGA